MGKSRIELDHHTAASELFGKARSGLTLRDSAFTSRNVWSADIAVQLNDRTVLINTTDPIGTYRRPNSSSTSASKSLDFLAAGYIVVRLREDGLPTLGVEIPATARFASTRQRLDLGRSWKTVELGLPNWHCHRRRTARLSFSDGAACEAAALLNFRAAVKKKSVCRLRHAASSCLLDSLGCALACRL